MFHRGKALQKSTLLHFRIIFFRILFLLMPRRQFENCRDYVGSAIRQWHSNWERKFYICPILSPTFVVVRAVYYWFDHTIFDSAHDICLNVITIAFKIRICDNGDFFRALRNNESLVNVHQFSYLLLLTCTINIIKQYFNYFISALITRVVRI